MRDMVEDWGHKLEHSAEPVVMELPAYVPLFVGGDWLGRLEGIVVERYQPGGVDSLQLIARVADAVDLAALESCVLRIRPPSGELSQFMRALRCVKSTEGMVAFGHLDVNDANLRVPLFVLADDLPCDESFARRPCRRIRGDMQMELRQLAEELRVSAEEFREEAEQIRRQVRVEVRDKLRGIR